MTYKRPWQGGQGPAQEPARGLNTSGRIEGEPAEVVCERVGPQERRQRHKATKYGQVGGVHAGHHVLRCRDGRLGRTDVKYRMRWMNAATAASNWSTEMPKTFEMSKAGLHMGAAC